MGKTLIKTLGITFSILLLMPQLTVASDDSLTNIDTINLAGNGSEYSITKAYNSSDSDEIDSHFSTFGKAKSTSPKGHFTLVNDGEKNTTGSVLFNNKLDMSKDWSIEGDFKFSKKNNSDASWGKGYDGWSINDGVGIVVVDANSDEISTAGSGSAFGLGGLKNGFAMVLDAYFNKSADRQKANGINYEVAADSELADGDNSPGELKKLIKISNNRVLDSYYNGSHGGGVANVFNYKRQSVIKMIESNADGSKVSTVKNTLKAYSPSSDTGNNDKDTLENGEHFVVSWKVDPGQRNNQDSYSGYITSTWYGNKTQYPNGFTISSKRTINQGSTMGLISSNGGETASVEGSIKKVDYSLVQKKIKIKYLLHDEINGFDGAMPDMQDETIFANIGDNLDIGETVKDGNALLTPKKIDGLTYDEQQVCVAEDTDEITITYSKKIDKQIYDPENTDNEKIDGILPKDDYGDSQNVHIDNTKLLSIDAVPNFEFGELSSETLHTKGVVLDNFKQRNSEKELTPYIQLSNYLNKPESKINLQVQDTGFKTSDGKKLDGNIKVSDYKVFKEDDEPASFLDNFVIEHDSANNVLMNLSKEIKGAVLIKLPKVQLDLPQQDAYLGDYSDDITWTLSNAD